MDKNLAGDSSHKVYYRTGLYMVGMHDEPIHQCCLIIGVHDLNKVLVQRVSAITLRHPTGMRLYICSSTLLSNPLLTESKLYSL